MSKHIDDVPMVLETVFFSGTSVDMNPLPNPSYQFLSAKGVVHLPEKLEWNPHIEHYHLRRQYLMCNGCDVFGGMLDHKHSRLFTSHDKKHITIFFLL